MVPPPRSGSAVHRPISDIAGDNVAFDGLPIALARIAVAAAARRAERDSVALAEHVLLLGIGLLAVDEKLAGRAVAAAFDAEGREDRALGEEGYRDRRVAPAFDQDLLPETAAMAARPTRVGPELLVMEAQRRDVLADLDRGRADVGRPGKTGDAIALGVAAHAAVVEEHVGVRFAVADPGLIHAQ